MLFISVDKIKHGTIGATFNVAFSVPIDELPQLRELHEKYKELNMHSFSIAEQTETQTSEPLTCRNKEHYETCEYSDNCITSVCLKAFNEFSKMLDEAVEQTETQKHMDNVLTYIADKYQTTKEELLDGLIVDEPQTD